MKWAIAFALLALGPALAGWLRQNPRHARIVWMVIAFLPFILSQYNLGVAPKSFYWPGITQGMEITVLDSLSLAVLLSLPGRGMPRFTLLVWANLFAVAVSLFQARVPEATIYYVWQVGRMTLMFFAVARICEQERGVEAILTGLVLGLGYQFAYTLSGRFLHGMSQTGGTFGHQNGLGIASYLVVYPALALLLSGNRSLLAKAGPLAGIGVQILGASRATIVFAGVGYAAMFVLSGMRRWTPRKAVMAGAGLLVIAVAAPLASMSLESRFGTSNISFNKTTNDRAFMERAAWQIIHDRPFGIGANQFVTFANVDGYWSRAHVGGPNARSMVHNVYLLSIAELGYLGAVPFFLLLASAIFLCLRIGLRNKQDSRGEIMLGVGIGLSLACLHSQYEFVLVLAQVQYILFMNFGLAAGLASQIGRPAVADRLAPAAKPRRSDPEALPALQRGVR